MKKKILVVDDNLDDLISIKEVLEKGDYEVMTINDSSKVLEIMEKNNFNIISLDILMPPPSGYDLLKVLRKKLGNDFPIIFTSIIPKGEVNMNYVNGFIQKPFMPEDIINEVGKVLDV